MASSNKPEPVILSVKLKGHQGSVLCLDHSSSRSGSSSHPFLTAASLLSGSEDGTCRVWDLRASCRAALCIKCPRAGAVLSVAFGPTWQQKQQQQASMPNPSPFAREYSIYTAVENNVYGYDLRNITSPIITDPSIDFSFLEAPDEVNQIAFSPKQTRYIGRGRNIRHSSNNPLLLFLAAADDFGTVRVTDSIEATDATLPQQQRNKRVYRHGSEAMVTSLAFRPRATAKQTFLASGGTDCCIQLWDVGSTTSKSKGALSLCSVSIPTTDAAANQVCNPPMVHSLNWSPSGLLLAAGLGDGSVALLQHLGSSLVLTARLTDAHSGSVASCLFPEWSNNNIDNNAIAAHDRLFCTTGNDRCIVLWDLGVTVGGEKAVNPAEVLQLQSNDEDDVAQILKKGLQLSNGATDDDIDQPKTLFAFQHTAKPNWMVSSRSRDPVFPSSIFVADTSHDITAYTIPL